MTTVAALNYVKCGDTIFSRARQTFELRIEQTREELYDDWNTHRDKYGKIKDN